MRAPRHPPSGRILTTVAAALLLTGSSPNGNAPPEAPLVDAMPGDGLDGRAIYQCVLDNRFDSYDQVSRLVSGDRGDREQESRLRMRWKNWRDEKAQPRGGVLSKTIVKYTHPFDLRQSGYLIVVNEDKRSDQFVYLNESRRIRRVSLRREAVFGTDFSFEDIVPKEIDNSDYRRLPDVVLQERPVYQVEVVPKEFVNSEYSRFIVYVEKQHCVPLRTRYWDDREIEVKELTAPASSVKEYEGGIHVATEATMRNLQLETFTTLYVEELEPNKKLADRVFDLRRLEAH